MFRPALFRGNGNSLACSERGPSDFFFSGSIAAAPAITWTVGLGQLRHQFPFVGHGSFLGRSRLENVASRGYNRLIFRNGKKNTTLSYSDGTYGIEQESDCLGAERCFCR
jgi:hypothetical protein